MRTKLTPLPGPENAENEAEVAAHQPFQFSDNPGESARYVGMNWPGCHLIVSGAIDRSLGSNEPYDTAIIMSGMSWSGIEGNILAAHTC